MGSLNATLKNMCTSSQVGAAGQQGPQGNQGPIGPQAAGSQFIPGIQSVNTGININPTVSIFTLLVDASGGALVEGLPAAAGFVGYIINVKKIDSTGNTVGIQGAAAAENIDGTPLQNLTLQYQNLQMQSDGTQWNIL